MLHRIRAFFRISFFALGSLIYILRYLIKASVLGNDLNRALRIRREWFSLINWGLGVKVEIFGTPPVKPGLLVCNHRSYFDPLIIMRQLLAVPVGKIELASWPIIGYGARISGTIFVNRKTKEGRDKARTDIVKTLKDGHFVINFPEGTTHSNPQTMDFKPALFKDAVMEGFLVYPVALEYKMVSDAWINDDTFLGHFFECFGKRNTHVRISYGPLINAKSGEAMLVQSKRWIDHELLQMRSNWHQNYSSKIKNEATNMV